MASKLSTTSVQCQICLEDMTGRTPRALSCLHTFCHQCLRRLPKSEKEKERRLCPKCRSDVQKVTVKKTVSNGCYYTTTEERCNNCNRAVTAIEAPALYAVQCPSCRKETCLSEKGVKGLPINFLVAEMKDILDVARTNKRCDCCSSAPSSYFCEKCVHLLCNACKALHDEMALFVDHNVLSLKMQYTCAVHSCEAQYVCTKCRSRICASCVLSGDHKDHKDFVQDCASWISSKQFKISELKAALEPQCEDTKFKLEKLETYEKNTSEMLRKIRETSQEMKKALEQEERDLAEKLTSIYTSQRGVIRQMQRICSDFETFSTSSKDIPSSLEISKIADLETKGNYLQDAVAKLPTLESLVGYRFAAAELPKLGTLQEITEEVQPESQVGAVEK